MRLSLLALAVALPALFCRAIAVGVTLPGMDVLAAGYNAARWDGMRARIFDLSVSGSQVTVAAINKTFTAPAVVSVAVDLSLGLSYHKDVQEVYEAITERGQAVGVSESWWGMYQATLPPPFLMSGHLDPMFAQARDSLQAIKVPKTDAEQAIYNQVCCGPASFGTHYTGSVIVGARATVTTFVNSSFHSRFSEKTVEEQISFGFQWKKLGAELDHEAKDFERKMSREFKNNSHWRFTYEPAPPSITNATAPWLLWEQAAREAPVVVNMSVSSLANLFYDLPEVMAHMQKTIDFYVQHGKAPNLSDLSSKGLSSRAPVGMRLVPGLDVVGCGFDAPTLSSRSCFFNLSELGSAWSNPYYPNISYAVPLGYFALNTPESTVLNGTMIMETLDDYIEHSFWEETHHSHGFLGFGSKSEHKSTEKYYRNFYVHRYSLALSMRQLTWFTLRLASFPLPALTPLAHAALQSLPTQFDPENATAKAIFAQFFEAFGTHVVLQADMGGLVWAESWFESCLSRMYDNICIRDEVTKGWWVFHEDHDSHTCDRHITEDFQKYSARHYEMLGGTANVSIEDWEAWALSVKNDPRPVKMSLLPIHDLLISHPAKGALEAATLDFLRGAEAAKKRSISELEKLRPPPPAVCRRTEGQEPGALCPIVGYHGAYCPATVEGAEQAQATASNVAKQLPRGVGLTIDVSDGELRLPAWSFDFSGTSQTWTDPASGQHFLLPKGLKLNADVQAENVPVVRVFKTEDDLAAVWEGEYRQRSWLGGEFGNSKSTAELFDRFFSHGQSTSINQHPSALYRTALDAGWEAQLNSFAVEALKALPEAYDNVTYERFLDAWGTHVANDTLVGGMAEQQIAMKDCMWREPHLSGGLSEEELQRYLAMDLAKAPPKDSFYLSRRQLSLDHRVGGNPELTSLSSWQASLAQNPALLKIYSYQDWGEVASRAKAVTAPVVANLQRAIAARLAAAAARRAADRATAAQERVAQLQGPRTVVAVVGHGRRGSIAPEQESGQVLTMKSFADCPTGLPEAASTKTCSTGVNVHSWNRHELIKPLRYERTAEGGFRSVRCFDLDDAGRCIEHRGPLITKGCSPQPFANGQPRDFHAPIPERTVVAAVCGDCQVIEAGFAQDATLKCECAGYQAKQQQQSEGADCFVTHTGRLPNFKQCDPRWKCFPYAGHEDKSSCSTSACGGGGSGNQSNNICGSGCGITSTAMLLSYWLPQAVPPTDVARWLLSSGYRDDLSNETRGATCDGVGHTAICAAAEAWGMACQQSATSEDLDKWLAVAPVIAHVRHRAWSKPDSCKFTRAGHYIVIVGWSAQAGVYNVSDPNSCEDENSHSTLQELSVGCSLVRFIRIYSTTPEPLRKLVV